MSADFVKYDLGQVPARSAVTVILAHRANVHLVDAHNLGGASGTIDSSVVRPGA